MVVIYMIAVPLVQPFDVDGFRVGVAILEVLLFLGFWAVAEIRRTWWLTAIAGFQLISVVTFGVTLAMRDYYVATGVAIRLGAWVLINLTFFAGAWEVWADRKYVRESPNGTTPA